MRDSQLLRIHRLVRRVENVRLDGVAFAFDAGDDPVAGAHAIAAFDRVDPTVVAEHAVAEFAHLIGRRVPRLEEVHHFSLGQKRIADLIVLQLALVRGMVAVLEPLRREHSDWLLLKTQKASSRVTVLTNSGVAVHVTAFRAHPRDLHESILAESHAERGLFAEGDGVRERLVGRMKGESLE